MFKIVETIEGGKPRLCVVPSLWETEGTLSWPKFRADKLVEDGESTPDTTWFTMPCKIKRAFLPTYNKADCELGKMLKKSDTDESSNSVDMSRKRKRPKMLFPKKKKSSGEDFNDIAKKCTTSTLDNVSDVVNEINFPFSPLKSPEAVIIEDGSININTSENRFADIIANQQLILQNQDVLFQQMSNLITTFDTFAEKMVKKFPDILNSSTQISLSEDYLNVEAFQQIVCLEDLETLEKNLKEQEFKKKLITRLSPICGSKGNQNGNNNCFTLVDKFFSRKFLTLCSWAGGAREKREKIPFKIFKNVINVFFELIYLSDNTFSLKSCEDFFKSVLRNATRRNASSMTRNSTTKNRPKNLSYNRKTHEKKVDCKINKEGGILQEQKELIMPTIYEASSEISEVEEDADNESVDSSSGDTSD